MRIVSPVIRDAALEARNTTAPATSIGSPMRCNAAMRSITSERNSGFARADSVPGVRINVGATAFTVMLYFPHSRARHLVRCAMAALVMQYTDSVGSATKPCLGTQVDDATTTLPDHHTSSRLAGKKCPLQINCKRQVEVLFAHVRCEIIWSESCVVD